MLFPNGSVVSRIPPVTLTLLIAIVVCFLLQQVVSDTALAPFELWPWGRFVLGTDQPGQTVTVGFMPWQLISYSFLHGGWAHLLFNGWALYQFGSAAENVLGPRRFTFFYFFCVVGAGLCQLAVTTVMLDPVNPAPIGTIGASGGIFGLLLAFAVFYPNAKLIFLLFPVPVSARIAVMIYGGIELYLGLSGAQSDVAHFAHLGGLAFGWLLLRYWRSLPPFASRKPPAVHR
jgi:membrane associated rhomboid family serine protease